jgi:eukaryotic-like serine/threonine-protein kinase
VIGKTVGPFQVVAKLGAGGMGEVYRARDPRLNRDVALKVLPDSFANDPDRLARFTREAQTLAALNHPNIAHIHGLEESDGIRALVMELVEGEDLSEVIARGPLGLSSALPIARQIAEALEAAHEQGIIHRDLKPANVKVRSDGTVKVLDFGLAKALGPDASATADPVNSPTLTARATQMGLIMGTAAYMSPEQAKGEPVDRRSDLWAFGCVLYEMLIGTRPFIGDSVTETLAFVVTKEPDWTRLPADTPLAVRRLLRRCLENKRKRRLESAADARLEIEEALAGPPVEAGAAAPAPVLRRTSQLPIAVAAVLALGILTLAFVHFTETPATPETLRFTMPAPDGATYTPGRPGGGGGVVHQFALSPDGSRIAFVASAAGEESRLWVRRFDSIAATSLAETEGATHPFWSPDSRFIAYVVRDSRVDRIDVNGGPPSTICRVPTFWSAAWGPDDTILISTGARQGLMRVPASGGTLTPITTIDVAARDIYHDLPTFLPDGRFLYSVAAYDNQARSGVHLGRLGSSEDTLVLPGAPSMVEYLPSGQLLFSRLGVLMTVAFDLKTGRTSGEPVAVKANTGGKGQFVSLSASATGRVAYGSGPLPQSQLIWYERSGARGQPVGPAGLVRDPEISPDGQSVALSRVDESGLDNVWIADLRRNGVLSRLTSGWAIGPLWSSDGARLAFAAVPEGRMDIVVQNADGNGTAAPLVRSPDWNLPADWTRNGFLVYDAVSPATGWDIMAVPGTGDRKPVTVVATPYHTWQSQVSADGRWLAYTSDESAPPDVYAQAFPGGAGKVRISTGGARWPRWSRDGREVYYVAIDGTLTAVGIDVRDGRLVVGTPRAIVRVPMMEFSVWHAPYDVSADGRFLINVSLVTPTAAPITVISQWKN